MNDANLVHRLEAREILAHLDRVGETTCDPDVVAHLKLIAESPNQGRTPVVPKAVTVGKVQVQTELPHTRPAIPLLTLTEKMQEQGWTQEIVDAANRQQQAAVDDYERRSQDPPLTQASAWASASIPPGGELTQTPIGQRNAAGDECIQITEQGYSVFRCSRGHGYTEDRPGAKGCGRCLMGGDGDAVPTASDGDIDTRW